MIQIGHPLVLQLKQLGLGCMVAAVIWFMPRDSRAEPTLISTTLISMEGTVEVLLAGTTNWTAATVGVKLNVADQMRTGPHSRATLRLTNLSILRVGELMSYEIVPPHGTADKPVLELKSGKAYFLNRDKPQNIQIRTPTVTAAIRGTEFNVLVGPDGRTALTLIDGEVELTNRLGSLSLNGGEEGVVETGKAPVKTAVLNAVNAIQWNLYYPGVLDVTELDWSPKEQQPLADSLAAYQSGALIEALNKYPGNHQPASAADHLYLGALLLSVGLVEEAQVHLEAASDPDHLALADALRQVIAAVKFEPWTETTEPRLATEFLAESYYRQSRGDLPAALASAWKAVEKSPKFGFGWERVAELEFGFGHTDTALAALDKSLALAPRNPQAIALRGFLLAAQNRIGEAIKQFDQAITLDGSLGNAWLGRGLCKISRGQAGAGAGDLQIAAALEPNRAVLRSYLGKAFSQIGDDRRAAHELELAQKFDPNDPTSWLYLALLQYNNYRTADAINNLQRSQQLNDNRAVYRSRLLLDQDQAVRSANLANIYTDASMTEVGVRESARAVSLDYANFSSHLNLASSFDALRDPTRVNLRYESEWFNEYLLASLLAPVGAVSLSQNLSQQEYSRLFAANNFGLNSTTEYLSTGEYRETTSQFGAFGGTSYALDLDYQHNEGVRVNNGLDSIEWYSHIKQQITPQDSLLLLTKYEDYNSGDNFQYYDASSARPAYHYSETELPVLLVGWHHEWSPGIHTLILGGRLVDDQNSSDTNANQLVAVVNPPNLFSPRVVPFDVTYHSEFEIYSAELNQIFQREKHTDIFGARFQDGTIRADNTFDNPPPGLAPLFTLPSVSETDNNFRRLSLYAYHHWEIIDGLILMGGLAYDDLQFPANFRNPPLNTSEARHSQVSPKAALLWDIAPKLRLRAVYAQAVGGVSYDDSVQLEPTQLAGFSQSFRSLIAESLVGPVTAPRYEIIGGALDLRPRTNAWLSLQGEFLRERVDSEIGIFDYDATILGSSSGGLPPATPASTSQQLNYHEFNAGIIFNQIAGSDWFLEEQYQFTRSDLATMLPGIPAAPTYNRTTSLDANLQRFGLAATWQHPSGFYVRGEFWELVQQLGGSTTQPPGDDLPLLNLYAGYRFPHRRGELTVGVMNMCDKDYHFSPLNYHEEYPHSRAFYTRFRFNF